MSRRIDDAALVLLNHHQADAGLAGHMTMDDCRRLTARMFDAASDGAAHCMPNRYNVGQTTLESGEVMVVLDLVDDDFEPLTAARVIVGLVPEAARVIGTRMLNEVREIEHGTS